MNHTTILPAAITCLGLLLIQCEKRNPPAAASTPAAGAVSLEGFFTGTLPANPAQIHSVRDTAKPGDTITLTGLVMGRKKPFVEGAAAFILCDSTVIKPETAEECSDGEPPWNPCCADPADVARATATIQITGPDGRVVKRNLKGVHGLTELSEVTLTGIVDKASTPQAFIINATTIHVHEARRDS